MFTEQEWRNDEVSQQSFAIERFKTHDKSQRRTPIVSHSARWKQASDHYTRINQPCWFPWPMFFLLHRVRLHAPAIGPEHPMSEGLISAGPKFAILRIWDWAPLTWPLLVSTCSLDRAPRRRNLNSRAHGSNRITFSTCLHARMADLHAWHASHYMFRMRTLHKNIHHIHYMHAVIRQTRSRIHACIAPRHVTSHYITFHHITTRRITCITLLYAYVARMHAGLRCMHPYIALRNITHPYNSLHHAITDRITCAGHLTHASRTLQCTHVHVRRIVYMFALHALIA